MQKNISKTLHNFLIISLGNLIYTVAVAFFILPNNLITGGTTGLALFGQYMFHIPITAFVYVFNIAMFASRCLGPRQSICPDNNPQHI